jgi:hypothetical protein
MPWHDDSWKDSYDAWKTREPNYGDEPENECDHDETEMDVCTGRVECQICGARWFASRDEVDRELDRIATYDEWCAEQVRPWNRFKQWWRDTRLVTWARARWWAWRHPRIEVEDEPELPF